ncbi:MAG: succinate dehydrogenase, hydrophobic membrane anchor protein [Gammaproteobacteria bacterium]|nr:succinate dehydrogenase, hydrophobic membrane anchor protein [Gammaproteobacteria bacterium]MCY4277384.1 succinate dehydrogenase, hydrophobic membrane anchor protein [Gammaproteobacteria bacterium]MCY4323965.1 succinate dehydrogenase, hydrophobic membrane anchor protein [Gammaproteobacteria bacterium]
MSKAQHSSFGVTGFLAQRISSLVLASYLLTFSGYFLMNPNANGEHFRDLLTHPFMLVFGFAALIAYLAHAWVGLWTIGTDYVRPHYFGRFASVARLTYHAVVVTMLGGQALWWVYIMLVL